MQQSSTSNTETFIVTYLCPNVSPIVHRFEIYCIGDKELVILQSFGLLITMSSVDETVRFYKVCSGRGKASLIELELSKFDHRRKLKTIREIRFLSQQLLKVTFTVALQLLLEGSISSHFAIWMKGLRRMRPILTALATSGESGESPLQQ